MILNVEHVDIDNDDFWGIFNYLNDSRCENIRREFKKKEFRVDSDEVSYRTLNHWESKDLLCSERNNNRGWRKFSIVEIVWLEIIISLRRIGFSIDRIQVIKNKIIHHPHDVQKTTPFPQLEYFLFQIINEKKWCHFVVTNDECAFQDEREFDLVKRINTYLGVNDTYIVIPLNPLLEKYAGVGAKAQYKLSEQLDSKEASLLNQIRSGQRSSIKVSVEADGIKHVRVKKSKNNKSNIAELSRSEQNQDIVIKIRDGKKVAIEQEVIKTEK